MDQLMPFEDTFEKMSDRLDQAKRIAKLIGLLALAAILQGCPKENPNEVLLSSLAPKASSPEIEDARKQCNKKAMDVALTGGAILDMPMSEIFNDVEVIEQECLDSIGVIVQGD